MMHQVLPPGVQHREEADIGAEMFGVGADGSQGLGGGGKEQVVDHGFVLIGDRRNLLGQREDDMEILNVEKLGLSMLDPLRAGEGLALRAVPVAAAVVRDALPLATVALLDVTA
jgi:hypothetical protein